jgi:transcriptional regulator with XRE-family HTH domain
MTVAPAERALDALETARATGRRVRYAREMGGLSQAELGHVIGRSPATIRRIEDGERLLWGPEIIAAAQALGVSVAWLRGGKRSPERKEVTG